mgnify:CR=1 FL=1
MVPISETRKTSLIGMTRHELAAALSALGVPDKQLRMRISQIWGWLYAHGVREFEQMSNVAKDLREKLAAHYSLARLELAEAQHSNDGTRKYLFRLDDGQLVETVYIPELDRGTLCVSSQVGCTLTCRFGMVDIVAVETAAHHVTLAEIKDDPKLENMVLVNNSRLSVQPVTAKEWKYVCKMAGLNPNAENPYA